MSAPSITAVDAVLQTLPAEIVITDPDVVAGYQRDQSRFTDSVVPTAVVVPRNTADIAACLRAAHRHGVPVVPRGAGSGLSGAVNATAGCIVLSLHKMNSILELDTANRLAVLQPGVITADLRAYAADAGLYYPPDPGSVQFCSMGGNVATNAGGMCCVKYGVTGDFVIALEAVLADGQVVRTGRRTVKGVAGYDLTHLLVGSEGTLAVISEITVRLVAAPAQPHTLVASFADLAAAGQAVASITASGLTPSMLEILDRTTLRAVDELTRMGISDGAAALLLIQSDDLAAQATLAGIETLCRQGGATDVAVSTDTDEADMLLEARRQALPALERLGDWLLDDVAVPRSRVTDLIASVEDIAVRHNLTIGVFGHAGDGNLHPTIVYDSVDPASCTAATAAFDAITQRALDLGGTITGEHGVGRLKRRWLPAEHDAASMVLQHSIKNTFDPTGILNPGTVLATPW